MHQKKGLIKKICLFAIFILCGGNIAQAHHMRGIAHYGYADNDLQTPAYEEFRSVGDWQIHFSFVHIVEKKNCDLAVDIKNRQTGKPYQGKVIFQVFGNNENPKDIKSFSTTLDSTNTFRAGWIYETEGIYTLRIIFNDGIQDYREDFRMQVGKVGFNFLWFILPLSIIFILMGFVLMKRKREE